MRSGACPTTPKPYPCRPRRRRKPHQALAIIAMGKESGLGPLANHCTCQPRAWPIARTEGERRRPRQRPPAPGPPIFAIPLERGGPGCGGAGICGSIEPLPLLLSSLRHGRTKQQDHVSNQPQTHAAPEGRRTSPACGSCRRPLRSNEKQGSEESCAKAQNASFSSLFLSGRANQ